MVAKITTPASVNRALNYNEQKLKTGKAECLCAVNFLSEAYELNFHQKLQRFEHLNALNQRAKTNTLHISLNFDAEDKLSKEKLIEIASDYMDKIGFGAQPYLVYQHQDAGHSHLHIVTSTIQLDGKRIDTFNIGKNQSERARKTIEQEYNLVKAESKKQQVSAQNIKNSFEQSRVTASKVQYGKMETKRAIQNVLDAVIGQYKYSSLPELNAVLKQYNVMADRGTENSTTFKKEGLYYRALDDNGNKIGVPIKASLFHQKPTLKFLKQKFEANEPLKLSCKQRLKVAIDLALYKRGHTLSSLEKALQKDALQMVIRSNEEGVIYGLTYIDYKNKVVFNGSDLGKEYSAKGLIERLNQTNIGTPENSFNQNPKQNELSFYPVNEPTHLAGEKEESSTIEKTMDILMSPNNETNFVLNQLLRKRRKKKKPGLHL